MLSNVLKSLVLLTILANSVNSDICATDRVDNVYTKYVYQSPESDRYSQIVIEESGNQYLWDTQLESVGKPVEIDQKEKVLTRVQILGHQDCSDEDPRCKELKKFDDMGLIFVYSSNYEAEGIFFTRINTVDPKDDVTDLPFNFTEEYLVDIFFELLKYSNNWFGQKHLCVAFDYWNKELIYILNPNKSEGRENNEVIRMAITFPENGTFKSKVENMIFSHEFVGLFNYKIGMESKKKIYAITEDMTLFEITESKTFEQTVNKR